MRYAILAIALTACGDNASEISRIDACREQAEAWCLRGGFSGQSSGCVIWYTNEQCGRFGFSGSVSIDAENSCMDAISACRVGDEPAECVETWSTPGR